MTESRFQCSSCGHDAGEADGFCAFCGAQPGAAPGSPHDTHDTYLALITANVLRLRREWALAETKCSEVLRHDPENAGAHSLMGDILRDQGRYQDAIEWYKMALDKNPTNEMDRRKLEALIDHVFAGEPAPPLETMREFLGKLSRKKESGATVTGRPACPWAMLTAGVFAVTLLVAFSLMVVAKRDTSPPLTPTPASGAFGSAQARLVTTFARRERPAPRERPAEITGDIAQIEQYTLEQVRRKEAQFDPNCRVTGVEISPKQAAVQVKMSMPALWSPPDARRAMLRVAAVAAAAVAEDARFAVVRVRSTARPPTGDEELALVAEGDANDIRNSPEAGHGENAAAVFHDIWWSAALQEDGGEAAPGDR